MADGLNYDLRIRKRFEEKFIPEPNSGCWLWMASRNPDGYGQFQTGSRALGKRCHFAAHRISYELYIGDIPADVHVLHRCDNPSCVNPAHLWIGNHAKNMRDMGDKGRSGVFRKEKNSHSKLTQQQVDVIRADERVHRIIALDHGVSYGYVSKLKHRKNWI